jgi:hypothetical protein
MKSQMISWLATVCKTTREYADVKLATIAKAAGKDQSAVYRFEQGESMPRDIDAMVSAYAEVTGVPSQHIWADALAAWGKISGVRGLRERAQNDVLTQRVEQAVERAVQQTLNSLGLQVSQSDQGRSTSSTPSTHQEASESDRG